MLWKWNILFILTKCQQINFVQMFLLRILDNDRRSFHWFMLQAMAYNNRTEVKFQKQIAKHNKICLVRD